MNQARLRRMLKNVKYELYETASSDKFELFERIQNEWG
jgi:hypothetical protein